MSNWQRYYITGLLYILHAEPVLCDAILKYKAGLSSQWSYCGWIYNYLCNQCLLPLTLWIRISLRGGVLNTTLCHKVCQLIAAGQLFSSGTTVSSTNKTNHHNIAEILLKVTLNTITLTLKWKKPNNRIKAMFASCTGREKFTARA